MFTSGGCLHTQYHDGRSQDQSHTEMTPMSYVTCLHLQLGYFVCYTEWVIVGHLPPAQGEIVIPTVMTVTVSMKTAVQTSTPALKPCQSNLLLAQTTTIFLRLLALSLLIFHLLVNFLRRSLCNWFDDCCGGGIRVFLDSFIVFKTNVQISESISCVGNFTMTIFSLFLL